MTTTPSPTSQSSGPGRHRVAGRYMALVAPLIIGTASILIASTWRNTLPDPIATHWGLSGPANGFSSRSSALWLAGLGGVLGFIVSALRLFGGRSSQSYKGAVTAVSVGVASCVSTLFLATLWIQRGLASATGVNLPWWTMPASIAVGGAAAKLSLWATSNTRAGDRRAREPIPADAARITLGSGQRAAWAGWTRPNTALNVLLAGSALVLLVSVVAGPLPPGSALGLLFLDGLVIAMTVMRVTVGRNGLTVRSLVGWPHIDIPLKDVQVAAVTEVHPLKQFGGWGLRLGLRSRAGVISKAGSALEVTRGDGSRFVVTCDNAATAAALLNTLAHQEREAPSGQAA